MVIALGGSLGLHAAILSLPLGSITGAAGLPVAAAARSIQVNFRGTAADFEPALPPRASVAVPQEQIVERAPETAPEPRAPRSLSAPREAQADPGILPLADTHYEARQLTEIPRPLSEPPVGELERMISQAGTVRMTLFIDESGKVTGIDVQSATLPVDVVVRAAEIFSEVSFSPGRIGATAVKSRIGITVGAVSRHSYPQ